MRKMRKINRELILSPFHLLLAVSISLGALPAVAYDVVVPGDLDGDMIVSDEELEAAQSSFDAGKITSEELEKIEHINENYPRKVIDIIGREVTFYKPVERIITTEPNSFRIVIALGDGDKVVASEQMAKSCLCPDTLDCYNKILDGRLPDLPEIRTGDEVNYELMVSLYPDVVITDTSTTDVQEFESKVGCPCIVAGARDGGWIYSYDDGLYGQIELIGDLLEKEEEADELVSFIESKIDMIGSVTEILDESEKPTVYFASRGATKGFYDPSSGRDFTRTQTDYEPIEIAGGINAAKACEGITINVGIEQIIAWNPDYILVSCSSPDSKDAIDVVLTSPDLQSIASVQNGNVYNCFAPHCRGAPPDRNLFNIIYMAKLFHPEKFEDIDLEREGNEIFKAFLGVDGVFSEYADYLVWPREFINFQ